MKRLAPVFAVAPLSTGAGWTAEHPPAALYRREIDVIAGWHKGDRIHVLIDSRDVTSGDVQFTDGMMRHR